MSLKVCLAAAISHPRGLSPPLLFLGASVHPRPAAPEASSPGTKLPGRRERAVPAKDLVSFLKKKKDVDRIFSRSAAVEARGRREEGVRKARGRGNGWRKGSRSRERSELEELAGMLAVAPAP